MTTHESRRRSRHRIRLSTPEDLLAMIPFLVGFHPTESLVMVGLAGKRLRTRVRLGARVDLPPDDTPSSDVAEAADGLAERLARNRVRSVILVGYSADRERPRPLLRAVAEASERIGIDVRDAFCADGRRWWSEHCKDPDCCPPDGVPYDSRDHPVTAEAVFHGMTTLPEGATPDEQVSPLPNRQGVRDAVDEIVRVAAVEARNADGGNDDGGKEDGQYAEGRGRVAMVAAGVGYVTRLLEECLREPRRLSDSEVARLIVHLAEPLVSDVAWAMVDQENVDAHLTLWGDVARRAVPPYEVPVLAILAFTGWRSGNGALAGRAIDRALSIDPSHRMTRLMASVIDYAIDPAEWEDAVDTVRPVTATPPESIDD